MKCMGLGPAASLLLAHHLCSKDEPPETSLILNTLSNFERAFYPYLGLLNVLPSVSDLS